MKRIFLFLSFFVFLLNFTVFSGVLLADQEMTVHRLNEDGTVDTWTEWIPSNASVNSQKALASSLSDTIVEYSPELLVSSFDIYGWDISPECSKKPTSCSAACSNILGFDDFDQTWGPLSTPDNLTIVVGWKPNPCTNSIDGTLNFFISYLMCVKATAF